MRILIILTLCVMSIVAEAGLLVFNARTHQIKRKRSQLIQARQRYEAAGNWTMVSSIDTQLKMLEAEEKSVEVKMKQEIKNAAPFGLNNTPAGTSSKSTLPDPATQVESAPVKRSKAEAERIFWLAIEEFDDNPQSPEGAAHIKQLADEGVELACKMSIIP